MPRLTFDFPDDETQERFERWWELMGKASCMKFIEDTASRDEAVPYLFIQRSDDDAHAWNVWWDAIPF